MTESFTELLITLFSSAGLAGALFAALLSHVLKKARADADRRRQERTSLEIMRCEGEAAAGRAAADARRVRTGTLRRSGVENGAGRIQQLSGKKQGAQGQAGRRAHRALSAYGADGGQMVPSPLFTPFRKGAETESDVERRRGKSRASVFLYVPPYSGKKAIRPQQQNAHIPRFCCDDIFCKRLTARIRQMPRYDQRPLLLCIADNSSKIQWVTNTITNKTPVAFRRDV